MTTTISHTSDDETRATLETTLAPPDNVTSNQTSVYESISTTSDVIFQCAVLFIGTVGVVANAFVLHVRMRRRSKDKQAADMFIVNQLVLDLFSCVALVMTYCIKLSDVTLNGSSGYWLCLLVLDEFFVWIGIEGSTFNLCAIAVERYVKVCHPLWHRANFHPWMVNATIILTWLLAAVSMTATVFPTTNVVDGQCMVAYFWASESALLAFEIWSVLSFYVIEIAIFAFCYGAIFISFKRQQKTFPGANTSALVGGDNPQQKQVQLKVLKISTLLTLSFTVCWLPNVTSSVVLTATPGLTVDSWWYYGSLFFAFLNICTNAFIYGVKSDYILAYISDARGNCCRNTSLHPQIPKPPQQPQQPVQLESIGGVRSVNIVPNNYTIVQRY